MKRDTQTDIAPMPSHTPGDSSSSGGPRRKTLLPETPQVHIALFLVTIVMTMFVYWSQWSGPPYLLHNAMFESFVFSCSLLAILLSHELGHYLATKYYGIDATLPYFIPAPIGIGTFGAFIQIKEKIRTKRQLMDVGAAGPLAGMFVSLFLAIGGIYYSDFQPVKGAFLKFGDSLLFHSLILWIKGPIPEGMDLIHTPITFAAWLGFLVTALNLMPASQLDGGHVVYSMIGRKHRIVSRLVFLSLLFWGAWGDIAIIGIEGLPTVIALSVFGIYLAFAKKHTKRMRRSYFALVVIHIVLVAWLEVNVNTTMWLFWSGMLLIFRLDHPPVSEEQQIGAGSGKLDRKRLLIGIFTILVFLVTFIPQPIKILE